ncbi:phage regulatory CII family protein [Asaia sp. HN010]|uniref:phage regulatory CII family protein n=1 Tax=Asaia sp. HN010 TaxID=3081233 RepID=UPI00301AE404
MNVRQIKTATQAAIQAVGGIDAAASFVRVGRSQLSDYQNRHSPSVVPVDVAVELDKCAQQPVILSVMASQLGFMLLPIDLGDGCAATSMAEVASTVGDTMNATMRALSDGKIDQHEAMDLAHRLNDVIRVTSIALQDMQSLAYPERSKAAAPDDALADVGRSRPRGAR